MNISKNTRSTSAPSLFSPAFTRLSSASWGKPVLCEKNIQEQITFGLWDSRGGWREPGEVQIIWRAVDGVTKPTILHVNKLQEQKPLHAEIFELLENKTVSPETVVEKMLSLGYKDVTSWQ